MVSFVAMVTNLVGKIVYNVGNIKVLKKRLIKLAKRIKTDGTFLYYSIADGISIMLSEITQKIILFPTRFSGQYSLFGTYLKNG